MDRGVGDEKRNCGWSCWWVSCSHGGEGCNASGAETEAVRNGLGDTGLWWFSGQHGLITIHLQNPGCERLAGCRRGDRGVTERLLQP